MAAAVAVAASGGPFVGTPGPAAPALPEPHAALAAVRLLGRDIEVFTDAGLGVAGRPWPAQEVAAEVALQLLASGAHWHTVVELGAGCGALSIALAESLGPRVRVVATDLPAVVPLMQRNRGAALARSRCGGLRPHLDCCPLPWGDLEAARALLDVADGNRSDGGSASSCVVACEVAYWGGWDLFEEDTRQPLAETLDALIVGPEGFGLLVHEVRDATREASLFEMIRARGLEISRRQPSTAEPGEGQVGVWVLCRSAEGLATVPSAQAVATATDPGSE